MINADSISDGDLRILLGVTLRSTDERIRANELTLHR